MKQTRTQTQTHAQNMSAKTRHTIAQKAAQKEAARQRKNAKEKARRAARAAAANAKPAKAATEYEQATARATRKTAVLEITGEPKPGDTLRIGNHVATFQHISERKPLNDHEAARLEAGLQKSAESNRDLFLAAREVDRLKAELTAAEITLAAAREENGRILADIAPLFQRLPA